MSRLAELMPPPPKKGVRKFGQKTGKFGRNSAKFGRKSGEIRAKFVQKPEKTDFTRFLPEFHPNFARILPEFRPNFTRFFRLILGTRFRLSLQGDSGETGGAVQFQANQKSKVGFCSGQCIQASIRSVCGDGLEARNNTCKPDCGQSMTPTKNEEQQPQSPVARLRAQNPRKKNEGCFRRQKRQKWPKTSLEIKPLSKEKKRNSCWTGMSWCGNLSLELGLMESQLAWTRSHGGSGSCRQHP